MARSPRRLPHQQCPAGLNLPAPRPAAAEVNMPWADAWGAVDTRNNRLKYDFPPTVYYAMARDQRTMQQIQEGIQILRSNGVPSDYVFVSGRKQGGAGHSLWRSML